MTDGIASQAESVPAYRNSIPAESKFNFVGPRLQNRSRLIGGLVAAVVTAFMYIPVFVLGHPGFVEWTTTPAGLVLFAVAPLGMFLSVGLVTVLLLRYRLVGPGVVLAGLLSLLLRPEFHPRLEYLQFGAIATPTSLLVGYVEYRARGLAGQ